MPRYFQFLTSWMKTVLVIVMTLFPMLALAQAHRPRAAPPPAPGYQYESNPYAGDPERAEEGRIIFNQTCVICHGANGAGGRGPNLLESKLAGISFFRVVIEGRKGTQMPAWRLRLSPDEVWQLHAFVKSTDHYAD